MYSTTQTFQIIQGNCIEEIKNLPQVHCVITSPPYWKKRVYGDSDGEIGQENDVVNYISILVDIFNSINLHPLGSVWVNIGDKRLLNGSLAEIPSRFCKMMMDNGWLLADSVIWAKIIDNDDGTTEGGCMTEPCNARLNGNGWEQVYRFVKTKKVGDSWADPCAVSIDRQGVPTKRYLPETLMKTGTSLNGRNLHNVWRINMGQTSKSHYAVYPPELVERPVAFTAPILVNADGSLPFRIVEKTEYDEQRGSKRVFGKYSDAEKTTNGKQMRNDDGAGYVPRYPKTVGWTEIVDAKPGIVLDPFNGTGTTGEVALKLGRSFIGIDLYETNCNIARERCEKACELARKYNPIEHILTVEDENAITPEMNSFPGLPAKLFGK